VVLFIKKKKKIPFKNNVVHGKKQVNVKENHHQEKFVDFLENQLQQYQNLVVFGL